MFLKNIFVNNVEYTGKADLCGHALTPAAGMIAEWVALLCSVVWLMELPNGEFKFSLWHMQSEGLREQDWSFGSGSFYLGVSTCFLFWFHTSAPKHSHS